MKSWYLILLCEVPQTKRLEQKKGAETLKTCQPPINASEASSSHSVALLAQLGSPRLHFFPSSLFLLAAAPLLHPSPGAQTNGPGRYCTSRRVPTEWPVSEPNEKTTQKKIELIMVCNIASNCQSASCSVVKLRTTDTNIKLIKELSLRCLYGHHSLSQIPSVCFLIPSVC